MRPGGGARTASNGARRSGLVMAAAQGEVAATTTCPFQAWSHVLMLCTRIGPGLGGGRACDDARRSRRATAAQPSPAPTTFSPERLCPLFFVSVILGSCHYCCGDSISSPSSSQSSGYWWICIDLFLSAAPVG
jgi:hypothetical protein